MCKLILVFRIIVAVRQHGTIALQSYKRNINRPVFAVTVTPLPGRWLDCHYERYRGCIVTNEMRR